MKQKAFLELEGPDALGRGFFLPFTQSVFKHFKYSLVCMLHVLDWASFPESPE